MSSIVVAGNTSGSITLSAPAVAGASVLTLPVATDTLVGKATTDVLTNKTLTSPTISGAVVSSMGSSILTSGTAVASTSGTSIDFTGIPSWAKRVTVMFNGVSTNGASIVQIQIGTGSIDSTATYFGSVTGTAGAVTGSTLNSTGFLQDTASSSTYIRHGSMILTNISGNIWCFSGTTSNSDAVRASSLSGSKSLAGTLDRIRITTVNGTDTFDAGSINIMYE